MTREGLVVLSLCHGALLFGIEGCRGVATSQSHPAGSAPASASVSISNGTGKRSDDVRAKQQVEIPKGRVTIGSLPGDEGRDPTVEPVEFTVDLSSFAIDALPYPGIPGAPPQTGVSQAEAARLCGERGARLCGEIEWERACRGANNDPFSSGAAFDPTCAETPEKCVSSFGARSMGTSIEEWTASSIEPARDTPSSKDPSRAAHFVVKGAYANAPASAHRCASRRSLEAHSAAGKPIGFRCCKGNADAAVPTIPAIPHFPTFRRAPLDTTRLSELLATFPELARIRTGARLFRESEIASVADKSNDSLHERTAQGAIEGGESGEEVRSSVGHTSTSDPILWSPEAGTEILVMAGKSKGGAWVVALHTLPGSRYRLASSMIFSNEQGPIALAYQPNVKSEIGWSMCWGCPGESGAVTYREDHRVVIVQR
ncbi:MAG: hypothetical protein NVSMB1_04300 [Polyangiales bacterium]